MNEPLSTNYEPFYVMLTRSASLSLTNSIFCNANTNGLELQRGKKSVLKQCKISELFIPQDMCSVNCLVFNAVHRFINCLKIQ